MVWTAQHEEILCREILTYEPFNYKSGTVQRGEAWKLIAESLNSLDNPKYTVSHRSVREKYTLLEKNYKQKIRREERATGIAPEEPTDTEKALEEIIAKFEEIELSASKEREQNNTQVEKERKTATEMRNQCMETFSDTKKRQSSIDESPSGSKKRNRRSGDDTINYLHEKMEMEREFRNRELKLAEKREENMQQMLLQQQQQNQAMLALLMGRNAPSHNNFNS